MGALNIRHMEASSNWRYSLLPPKKADACKGVAADMEVSDTDNCCAVCGKPFGVIRKWRSLARLVYGGDLVVVFSWKLCGKCTHENGDKAPDCLLRQAINACDELLPVTIEPVRTA